MKAPTIEERHRVAAAELQALDARIADLEYDVAQARADFQGKREDHGIRPGSTIDELREQASELGGRLNSARTQRETLAAELRQLTASITAASEMKRTSEQLRAIFAERDHHRDTIDRLDRAIAAVRAERESLDAADSRAAQEAAAANLEARLAGTATPMPADAPNSAHRRQVLEHEERVATARRGQLEQAIAALEAKARPLEFEWSQARLIVAERDWADAAETVRAKAAELVSLRRTIDGRLDVDLKHEDDPSLGLTRETLDAATARLKAERLAAPKGRP